MPYSQKSQRVVKVITSTFDARFGFRIHLQYCHAIAAMRFGTVWSGNRRRPLFGIHIGHVATKIVFSSIVDAIAAHLRSRIVSLRLPIRQTSFRRLLQTLTSDIEFDNGGRRASLIGRRKRWSGKRCRIDDRIDRWKLDADAGVRVTASVVGQSRIKFFAATEMSSSSIVVHTFAATHGAPGVRWYFVQLLAAANARPVVDAVRNVPAARCLWYAVVDLQKGRYVMKNYNQSTLPSLGSTLDPKRMVYRRSTDRNIWLQRGANGFDYCSRFSRKRSWVRRRSIAIRPCSSNCRTSYIGFRNMLSKLKRTK